MNSGFLGSTITPFALLVTGRSVANAANPQPKERALPVKPG
jgi:hypothetical protein